MTEKQQKWRLRSEVLWRVSGTYISYPHNTLLTKREQEIIVAMNNLRSEFIHHFKNSSKQLGFNIRPMYKVEIKHLKKAYRNGDLEYEITLERVEEFSKRKIAVDFIENNLRGKSNITRDYHKGNQESRCTYLTGEHWVNENTGETMYEGYYYIMKKI